MFEHDTCPRVFALPPGADFAQELAQGFWARLTGAPPEAAAQANIFVTTRRMAQQLTQALAQGIGPGQGVLLPRIRLLGDLADDWPMPGIPAAVPALRRRLELGQMVARLLDVAPDLAPRAATFDLADSLAALLDEMQDEGVPLSALEGLDLANHSDHWRRSLRFIELVGGFLGAEAAPDALGRQRHATLQLIARWQETPPKGPVIIAGSTGSRGTTALLMEAVARLPQGALVLPGFDFEMPQAVWDHLGDALSGDDHPQFRFHALMQRLGLEASDVMPWVALPASLRGRNALVSLALRPAPVTDQWMTDGPHLPDLAAATAQMTLLEAPSPRAEALAVALCLREAAETDQTAALITPDRELARQVTAALDRWDILPDDSAGRPLALSAPGRLLRQTAALFCGRLTAEGLLALLKHPLTASGAARGAHLRWSRELELRLRRHGPQFPLAQDLLHWAGTLPDPDALDWAIWIAGLISDLTDGALRPLADHATRHLVLVETLATGPGGDWPGTLWQGPAGVEAQHVVTDLLAEAAHGGQMSAQDYADLLGALLARAQVRETVQAHRKIMILGPREAREGGVDLVILAGLTEGTWPATPSPDPWLNRSLRHAAGLLLPERQIGLSAHDFQQAIAARRVVLSRALRSTEAETVAARWLNRLTNLLQGLPAQGGDGALAQMRARAAKYLAWAEALDTTDAPVPPAPRPAPCPPVAARPRELFVTQISKLIRDPYSIYARHILRLKPLDPLHRPPDLRERGTTLHEILERFLRDPQTATLKGQPTAMRAHLLGVAADVLAADVPWPAARHLWHARLARVADWFLAAEASRPGQPVLIEKTGSVDLGTPAFRLSARPDRVDLLPDGRVQILDYKTGAPPSEKQQAGFDKQLLLQAAMAERGGFAALGPVEAARITYVGLGSPPKQVETDLTPAQLTALWAELVQLIENYLRPNQGYAARRAMHGVKFASDYDHLSRFGEWDISAPAVPISIPDPRETLP